MTDNTDTYLNLDSNQFNTWIKEFEDKYQQVENNTNIKNNLEIFNNSVDSSEEYELEDDESDEIEYSDDETSNVFIAEKKVKNNSSTNSNKLLYNRTVTRLRKTKTPDTINSTNKKSNSKKLISSESSSLEKNVIRNKKNESEYSIEQSVTEKKIDEILSLKQLNNMIPAFSNRSTKINKHVEKKSVEVENVKINNTKSRKLGEHALYKFIINKKIIF